MSQSNSSTSPEIRPALDRRAARPYMAAVTAASLAAAVGMAPSCTPIDPGGNENHPTSAFTATVSEGPALPGGRACHAGGMVGGRVVVAGGSMWSADQSTKQWLSDTLVFDASAGGWIAGPPLPHACAEMAFAGDGEALYIAGGKHGPTTHADVFRIVAGKNGLAIEPLPPLPTALSGCAGAMLDGVFYVAGGFNSAGTMADTLWALDVRKVDTGWHRRAAMPAPTRVGAGLTAAGDALFLFGGCVVETLENPTRQVFKTVHRYETANDHWSRLADLPVAGQGWIAEALDATHLLLTGRGDTGVYDDIWLVDLHDSSVKGIGSLVTPSFGAPLVRIGDGYWWFIAGEFGVPKSRTPRVSVISLKTAGVQ